MKRTLTCIICGYSGYFYSCYGRDDARCPNCLSLERHRHQWFVAQNEKVLARARPGPILHFAAEMWLAPLLKQIGPYISVDLNKRRKPRPDIVADARRLPFSDNQFTLVWASHLLEQIVDCNVAICEIFRILKPGKIAVLDVPIFGPTTQLLQFPDQYGNIWQPGRDWFQRYEAAGFQVTLHPSHAIPQWYGAPAQGIVAVCTKPL